MTRGLTLALAAVLALGSCRSLTAPQTPVQRGGVVAPSLTPSRDDAARGAARSTVTASEDARAQVPVVERIESVADARGLHFRLHLQPERLGDEPFYAPSTPGGWQFQAFLDVDRNPFTGYAFGFDFLTRDSEPGLEPGTLVLRHTEGGGGPGGWGDEVTRIPVRVAPRLLTFTVPLEAIGDDGVVDFELDLYATVAGGEDGLTPVAHFVRYYTGHSVPRHHRQRDPSVPGVTASATGGPGGESEPRLQMERRVSSR